MADAGGSGAKLAVGGSQSQVIHKIIAGVLETAAKPSSDLPKIKGPLWLILAVAADELVVDSENAFYPLLCFQQM